MTALALALASTAARAHGGDAPDLHVGYAYDSCYFDLHEDLTGHDFTVFAREFADAGGFLPMSGAASLGAGHVALGLTYDQTFLHDAKPAWNDTFSHPGDDHFLGSPALPTLQGRVGIAPRFDLELMVTGDPQSNWAIGGVAARRELLSGAQAPVGLTARASYVHLFGAEELDQESGALELLASRGIGPVTAYAGAGPVLGVASERTDELELGTVAAVSARATLGAELAVGHLRVAGQGTLASVPTLALMAGAAF